MARAYRQRRLSMYIGENLIPAGKDFPVLPTKKNLTAHPYSKEVSPINSFVDHAWLSLTLGRRIDIMFSLGRNFSNNFSLF